MQTRPPVGCTAGPAGGKMREWVATITGPAFSPYHGGVFRLAIEFPNEYPQVPPKVKFLTKIYHMNVAEDGDICLDILDQHKKWNPNISVSSILTALMGLLSKPNPDDPLNYEKGQLYKKDQIVYSINAQEWTNLYAK